SAVDLARGSRNDHRQTKYHRGARQRNRVVDQRLPILGAHTEREPCLEIDQQQHAFTRLYERELVWHLNFSSTTDSKIIRRLSLLHKLAGCPSCGHRAPVCHFILAGTG